MSTEVYLGYPPPSVRRWIEEEYRKRKTIITFEDQSTEEYDWSGEVNQTTLVNAGLYSGSYDQIEWLKSPVQIQFGTTVTSIGDGAFFSCTSLTSVSMPNVTSIGAYAFYQCENITSVSMPNVTTVGDSAFYQCENITSVSMPNVTSIGNGAFRECTSLASVSMPNVTSIDADAFFSCTSLASVSMPNVTSIGAYAFQHTSLASVSMPNVTSIGIYAFSNISTSVEFENQTTSKIDEWFGNWVFGDSWGPVTVTCSGGSVYAQWDGSEHIWTVEITPAQQ